MSRILVVEDNEVNREMLVRRLERQNFEVQCAADGRSAIEQAKLWMPDLILMDIALGPEMDGWEATTAIKDDPRTSDIPIIALTAHALESDRKRSALAGCLDHEIKPVDFARLLGKIERAIVAAGWVVPSYLALAAVRSKLGV